MWDTVIKIGSFITNNYQSLITGLTGALTGIIAICMLIPGDQPEKFLQGIVDFISKFSSKPKNTE